MKKIKQTLQIIVAIAIVWLVPGCATTSDATYGNNARTVIVINKSGVDYNLHISTEKGVEKVLLKSNSKYVNNQKWYDQSPIGIVAIPSTPGKGEEQIFSVSRADANRNAPSTAVTFILEGEETREGK
ncbi:MAG: hypothetical protein WCV79_03625 [Candidatus Paceibacterota bacterium]